MPLSTTACCGSSPQVQNFPDITKVKRGLDNVADTIVQYPHRICAQSDMFTRLTLDRPYLHRKNSLPLTCSNYLVTLNAPGTLYLSITYIDHTKNDFLNLEFVKEAYFVRNSHMWSDAQKGYFPQHTRNSRKAVTSNFTEGTFRRQMALLHYWQRACSI